MKKDEYQTESLPQVHIIDDPPTDITAVAASCSITQPASQSIQQFEQRVKQNLLQSANEIIDKKMERARKVIKYEEARLEADKYDSFKDHQWMWLVSSTWLEMWKKSIGYDQVMKTKNKGNALPWDFGVEAELEIMNKDLVDETVPYLKFKNKPELSINEVVLKPNLIEYRNFAYFDKKMWDLVKDYSNIQVKRQIVKDGNELKVQIYLQKVHKHKYIDANFQNAKKKKMVSIRMQMSKFKQLGEVRMDIEDAIVDQINSTHTLIQLNANQCQFHFWAINSSFDIKKIHQLIEKSFEHQENMKQFTFFVQGNKLQDNKQFGEQLLSANPIIICEIGQIKKGTLHQICYNAKINPISICPFCNKQSQLNSRCNCNFIIYCSQKCLNSDSNHIKKCPNKHRPSINSNGDSTYRRYGLTGLTNLGNTCYMNSGLQCLSNITELTDYFLSKSYQSDINYNNSIGTKGNLSHCYYTVLNNLWNGSYARFSPQQFKRAISSYQRMFSGYDQHDSGEFITCLLDGLHEDLNKISAKPYFQSKDFDDRPEQVIAEEQWRQLFLRNNSKIVELMYGQYRSQVDCPECRYKSIQFDPFLMCSLPIPQINQPDTFQKTIRIYCVKSGLNQKVVLFPYKSGNTMGDVAAYLKNNNELDDGIVKFYESKNVIQHHESVIDVKTRFLRNIYARVLSKEEFKNGTKVHVTVRHKNNNANSSNPYVIFTTRIYFLNLQMTFNQMHQFLYSKLKLPDFQSFQNLMKKDKRRIIVKIKREESTNFTRKCWCCKTFCQGCRFPQIDQSVSRMAEHQHTISLEYTIDAALSKNLIDLSATQKKQLNLISCFKAFESPQTLNQENAWFCPKCKRSVKARKQMSLYKTPQILIICLKRFKKKGYYTQKNHSFVKFPIKGLDLNQVMAKSTNNHKMTSQKQENALKYDLFAVSYHAGEAGGGHYIAKCRNNAKNCWYEYDDIHVNQISEERVVNQHAYILFYRRRS